MAAQRRHRPRGPRYAEGAARGLRHKLLGHSRSAQAKSDPSYARSNVKVPFQSAVSKAPEFAVSPSARV